MDTMDKLVTVGQLERLKDSLGGGGSSSPKTTVTLERLPTDWHVGYFHDGVYTDEVASPIMTIEVDLGTVLSVYGPSQSTTLSASITGDLIELDESELWHHHFLVFRSGVSSSIFFSGVVAP